MQKILIIGSSGSGKSTLARKLGDVLNLPVVHLDQLFWLENWVQKDRGLFKQDLLSHLEKDKWIIDGCFINTLPMRLEYCDHVILLNYPTLTCVWRVIKRVITNKGKTRPDMANNCPERFDFDFLKYVLTFKHKKLKKIKNALKNCNAPITEIKNNRDLKAFLNKLSEQQ